jgi:hypothetical protein
MVGSLTLIWERSMMQIPEHVKRGEIIISPTRVEGGIKCIRKHVLDDVVSYKPSGTGPNVPQEFGVRMHKGVGHWWADRDLEICIEYLHSCEWPLNEKHTLGLAINLMTMYSEKAKLMPFAAPGDDWQLVALEERVLLPIGNVVLSWQLDRLAEEKRMGLLAMTDVKTASRTDGKWEKQWPTSIQMKLYSEAIVRKYGRELDWLIIEGLQKGPALYKPYSVPIFSPAIREEAMRNFEWVVKHDAQLLDNCMLADGTVDAEKLLERALTETPHNPAECYSYYSTCDYRRLCDAEPSERLGLLKEGFEYHEPDYV